MRHIKQTAKMQSKKGIDPSKVGIALRETLTSYFSGIEYITESFFVDKIVSKIEVDFGRYRVTTG